jgi:enoyl-CoA hydratase
MTDTTASTGTPNEAANPAENRTPDYATLEVTIEAQVATVSLNRPDKANAMNPAMWEDLQACFEWLDEEPTVRAVVLAGNGKHFCAGLDLAMFADGAPGGSSDPARRAEQFRRKVLRLQDNLTAIEQCRVPVLAAIHNTCIGGGVDMTCCCDMRYATEDAYFSIREIDIGMTADVGTLQRMPRIVPDGVVRELAYTGRNMDAEEAREVGFINRVYEDRETMLREVTAIARSIAGKSPLAVRGTKEMLLYARDHSVADGLNYIATWNAGMMSQQDLMSGVQAQAEKKQASYED